MTSHDSEMVVVDGESAPRMDLHCVSGVERGGFYLLKSAGGMVKSAANR